MAEPERIEQRLTSIESRLDNVETRLEDVATDAAAARRDAAAARYLAAAHDRDLADLGVKVDAHRRALNALGEQTAARFAQVDRRFGQVDRRFDQVDRRFDQVDRRLDGLENEMRAGFATSAAGHQQIVGLLDHVIARLGDE